MLRWLFAILAALSLILALVTAGMWIRGRFVVDQLVVNWYEPTSLDARGLLDWDGPMRSTGWTITLGDGGILVLHAVGIPRNYSPQPSAEVHRRWERLDLTSGYAHGDRPAASERVLGFGRWRFPGVLPGSGSWSLLVPYWAALLVWSVLPAVWIVRFIRHRRLVMSGH